MTMRIPRNKRLCSRRLETTSISSLTHTVSIYCNFPMRDYNTVARHWRQSRERQWMPEKSEQLGSETHTDLSSTSQTV